LTICGRQSNQTARFSLLDILKHLNIQKAILKGSATNQWRSNKTLADIDLQLPVNSAIDKNQFTKPLLEFLNQRSNLSAKGKQAIQEKTWFSKVRHDLKDSWARLIISIGYPAQNATTLDINLTNYRGIAYDTIQASRVLQFDWAQSKTHSVGSWHPSLVDWLAKNQLLWFNPDIDEGLSRLSYRLSKSSNARLLQPRITLQFFEQASPETIGNIYLRVLMDEYPSSTLSTQERKQLWAPVLQAAATPKYESLKSDLLGWTTQQTLDEVTSALNAPETQVSVLDQLTKACQIGIDFKNSVKNFLMSQEEFDEPLKPLIQKALGAHVVSGESIFNMLDNWSLVKDIPKHELLTVFTELLTHTSTTADPSVSGKAAHMLGWLHGDEVATLQFWMDRIPDSARNAPPEKLMPPVIQSLLKIIKTKGTKGLEPVLPQLSTLRISRSDWHTLTEALETNRSNIATQSAINLEHSRNPVLGLMEILTLHSAVLGAFAGKCNVVTFAKNNGVRTEQLFQNFYQDLMVYAHTLQEQKTPPVLRNFLTVKSDGLDLALPDMTLTVSFSQESITANLETNKFWVTEHARAKLNTEPFTNSQSFYMEWHDGSLFSGESHPSGKFIFDGVLTHVSVQSEAPEISGLLNTGRLICQSRFPGIDYAEKSWAAKGHFNSKQLLKTKTLADALLVLKQGVIVDQLMNSLAKIEHEIENNLPTRCFVTVTTDTYRTEMNTRYRRVDDTIPKRIQFQNVWGVEPVMDQVESIDQLVSAPFGVLNFESTTPWDEEQQTLQGLGEIKTSGVLKFKWAGEFKAGQLLPEGSLYLDKSKTPSITFKQGNSSSNIPRSLLPVMADLLGRLSGEYTFSNHIWHDPDTWPIPGFEGFVNNFTHKGLSFSGYLTSMGRAIGILRESPEANKDYYSTWTGSFYVRPTTMLDYQPVRLDRQELNPVCIPLSEYQVLTPHGFVREFLVEKNSHQPRARVDRMYFCGESMMLTKTTRSPEISYDSPNATRYMAGVGYTMNEQAKHLDLVYNPSDKGNDFFVIRPENFDKLSNYQEIYRDSMGTSANWLVVNKQYRMVNAKFLSGVEYSGKVERQGNLLRPTGNGKLSFNALSFTADFEKDNTIKNIKAMNHVTSNWMATNLKPGGNQSITLSDWMKKVSNGRLDWQKDVQAQLMLRDLSSVKNQGIIFSRK